MDDDTPNLEEPRSWSETFNEGKAKVKKAAENLPVVIGNIGQALEKAILGKDDNGNLVSQPETYIGPTVFDPSLGTAALVPTRDLVHNLRYDFGSFFLGRSIEDDLSVDGSNGELCAAPIGHKGEGHILICAETRTGKSERILVGNLGLWPGSALVVDCKGMLATMTAERRGSGNPAYCEGMGQDVYVIDPKKTAQNIPDSMRASINPISWLTADDPNTIGKARLLAEALIPDDDGKSSDPYWTTEGRELLAVLMTHVATSPFIDDDNRILVTVYRLIMAGDTDIIATLLGDGSLEENQVDALTPFEAMFQHMLHNPVFNDYVPMYATGMGELFENARKQWEGIRSQATQSLDWLADPEMLASMRNSSLQFSDLKTKPHGVSVYLSIPSMAANWRWVRLMVKMFTEETRSMTAPATGHQTLVVLDEFTSMKYMPEMDELMDKSAEYGIRMCIVIQRMEQIKRIYPKSWGQFFAAADVRWFFGMECQVTREYIEKELGEVEVIRQTRNISVAKGATEQITEGLTESTGTSNTNSTNNTTGSSESTSDSKNKSKGGGTSNGRSRNHKDTILGELAHVGGIDALFENGFFHQGNHTRNGGRSTQYSRSTGRATQQGTSKSEQVGQSKTEQESSSTQQSLSTGTSLTKTIGMSENIHKRPLMAASELPSYLAKVEDVNDPRFPGMALVIMRGGTRTMVRTSKYYDDHLFHRTFSKHPLYDFRQTPYPWSEIAALSAREKRIEEILGNRIARDLEPILKRQKTERWLKQLAEEARQELERKREWHEENRSEYATRTCQLVDDVLRAKGKLIVSLAIDTTKLLNKIPSDHHTSVSQVHAYGPDIIPPNKPLLTFTIEKKINLKTMYRELGVLSCPAYLAGCKAKKLGNGIYEANVWVDLVLNKDDIFNIIPNKSFYREIRDSFDSVPFSPDRCLLKVEQERWLQEIDRRISDFMAAFPARCNRSLPIQRDIIFNRRRPRSSQEWLVFWTTYGGLGIGLLYFYLLHFNYG